jgi:hypothetical protein
MSDTPPLGSLDDVQAWMIGHVWRLYEDGVKNVVLQAATGTGKATSPCSRLKAGP